MGTRKHYICPAEKSGRLDNRLRKFGQNPKKILAPFIKHGLSVLDFGCGPGFFTVEIARLLNKSGKIVAADMQKGMLDRIKEKVANTELENTIEFIECKPDSIGINEKFDFILAFYVVHEVENHESLFTEFKKMLKYDGKILIAEPLFHVTKTEFEKMKEVIIKTGFKITNSPKISISRSIILEHS